VETSTLSALALVILVGVGSQWLAWRLRIPSIVLMLIAGLLLGPVFGIVAPRHDLGPMLQPIVAAAVAIILFDGGLNLNLHELREAGPGVRRLVLLVAPIGWVLGAVAGHFVAGLSWPVAFLFAGILVVTGPTVIMPLLRHTRLKPRVASLLKWEGIVNDPIGALLAVLVYEFLTVAPTAAGVGESLGVMLSAVAVIGVASFAIGRGLISIYNRGHVPEYLRAAILLSVLLGCYVAANALYDETGLLAVTVLGMTLANGGLVGLAEVRRFKESLATLLVAAVFILLTASLRMEDVLAVDARGLAFVAVMLFVVRPASVWLGTIGAGLPWQERALVGWIAPRGIVAVAITGLFGPALVGLGYPDARQLVPLAFAIVLATVVLHGFSIGVLARYLGLADAGGASVLILGASPWTVDLAGALKAMGLRVTIADPNRHRLRTARLAGVDTYFGDVLSEVAFWQMEVGRFDHLLAVTDNDAYNTLACAQFAPDIGRDRVMRLKHAESEVSHRTAIALEGGLLTVGNGDYDRLVQRSREGWTFTRTKLTATYDLHCYLTDRPEGAEVVAVRRASGRLRFLSAGETLDAAASGDVILAYTPPKIATNTAAKPPETAPALP
jgi:NhaP-type Na+/H+ and K+/H+ antiporters